MKHFLQISKGIVNYIFAMIFAIIFALFLDANVGWFLLLSLILAPLLSVFLAWISSRLLTIDCETKEFLLAKGDTCSVTIHLTNKSIFPTPPLDISLTQTAGMRCFAPHILASVISRATQSFSVSFSAQICGESTIGISQIRVTDYLGLFSFPVRKINYELLQTKVAVIPNIAEISARDDNLLKTMQASLHTEGSDDTTESAVASFGGFPGYNNREYTPGDPLKRINWKQSARKNKLLVRLDDEMASQAINVVLDSTFQKDGLNTHELLTYSCFNDCTSENVLHKAAESAIENALGILYVLLRHNYTINFFARFNTSFVKYEINDEQDLENLRLDLAHYRFSEDIYVQRFPLEDLQQSKSAVSLFSTPNTYANAHEALLSYSENMFTTIYSVMEEGKKHIVTQTTPEQKDKKSVEKVSYWQKLCKDAKLLPVPFLLALVSSLNVFYAFNVPFFSYWTILQILMCFGIFLLCEYVQEHRFVGGLVITILVVGILYAFFRIMFEVDWGRTYIYWFMSGGDSIKTTFNYLLSLLLVFTVFFAMVMYYFTMALYRTSFLMLVSLIPFVIHVKLMHKMEITYAVIVMALNILAFLLHNRAKKDHQKRKIGQFSGILSLSLYTILFLMIGLAVPKEKETRYYYIFENLFLGGNVSTILPEEYSAMSDHSGNADNFEQLNDRKLYEIRSVDLGPVLYLTRQTFDYYDFKKDYWKSYDYSSTLQILPTSWEMKKSMMNQTLLAEAIHAAEEVSPGFMAKYGLENIPLQLPSNSDLITIETTNFPSVAYVTPPGTYSLSIMGTDIQSDFINTALSKTGVYQRTSGFLQKNLEYSASYYDALSVASVWADAGGCNMSLEESINMLLELSSILNDSKQNEYFMVASYYLEDAFEADVYRQICSENNASIPYKVKELALEITKDCTNDWEKAIALQAYFEQNDFVYDLSYRAPDDSVEYFLFEGKTGTCSDYASAYVLMARSIGLVARYAEGFVPEAEYGGEYVVRTDCGHAYPEVYIPNVGYVVFEATKPAIYREPTTTRHGNGFTAYLMVVDYRALIIFAVVSAIIIFILFIHLCLHPFVSELLFRRRTQKTAPADTILMIYKRICNHYTNKHLSNAHALTPREYGIAFKLYYSQEIDSLISLVEMAAYTGETLNDTHKEEALNSYKQIQKIVRKTKKKA